MASAFKFLTILFCVLVLHTGCKPAVEAPLAQKIELKLDGKIQVLNEMYQVVLKTDRVPSEMYKGQLTALDQGASLIGLYNGLIHSAAYREFEKKGKRSNEKSILIFSKESALLAKSGLEIKASHAQPLPQMMGYDELEQTGKVSVEPTLLQSTEIEAAFRKASSYTLKRVWSDLLMNHMSQEKNLFEWYADFAVRTSEYGTVFGVSQRNSKDRSFHLRWAQSAPVELLQWEVLNRAHRLINEGALQ